MAVDLGFGSESQDAILSNSVFGNIVQQSLYFVPAPVAERVISNSIEPHVTNVMSAGPTGSTNNNSTGNGTAIVGPFQSQMPVGYAPSRNQSALGAQAALVNASQKPVDQAATIDAAWSDFDQRAANAGAAPEATLSLDTLRDVSRNPAAWKKVLFGNQLASGETSPIPVLGPQLLRIDSQVQPLASDGQNVGSLLIPTQSTVTNSALIAQRSANVAEASLPSDPAGWFCNTDGSLSSVMVISSMSEGEGPSAGDGSSTSGTGGTGTGSNGTSGDGGVDIPQITWPQLKFPQHDGSLGTFAPPVGTATHTVTTGGSFTENTTANSDLTVPGVNFVHIVDLTQIDATHWSFTETLVLAFNVSNAVSDSSASGSNGGNGTTGTNGMTSSGGTGTGTGTTPTIPDTHNSQSQWSSSVTASRSGFVIMTFHAEQGMSGPSEAGVAWSLTLGFHDEINLIASVSGGESVTPFASTLATASTGSGTPPSGGSTSGGSSGSGSSGSGSGGSSGGGTSTGGSGGTSTGNTGGGFDGDTGGGANNSLPADYSSTSAYSLSLGIKLWVSGNLSISHTPSLVANPLASGTGTVVHDTFTSSGDSETGSSFVAGGTWSASSRSGHCVSASPTGGGTGGNGTPFDNMGGGGTGTTQGGSTPVTNASCNAVPWTIPTDGSMDGSVFVMGGANQSNTGGGGSPTSSPIPALTRDGHEFGSSGGFESKTKGKNGGSWNVAGNVEDGRLKDISGLLSSALANQIGDKYNENEIYSVRISDGDATSPDGFTANMQVGWNLKPEDHADILSDTDVSLVVVGDGGIDMIPTKDDAKVMGGGSDSEVDFMKMEIDAWATLPHGTWTGSLRQSSKDSDGNKNTIDVHAGLATNSSGSGSSSSGSGSSDVDASGFLKFDWNGHGSSKMEVHTNSNVDWYPTFVDNAYASHLIEIRKLDYISNGTYNSTGDANFDLAADGTITKSGSGTATNVTDSDYQSHTRDFGEWSRSGPNGYYYLQDTNRYGAFVGTVTRSASFNASQEPPITIATPSYSGDPKVRVWGTYYAEGSDHVGSVMYLDDHSGGNYYAKIEADLNGIPLVVIESITLPPEYVYPSNPNPGDGTYLAWFAGRKGDAFDTGANYVSGLGDNLSMGLSWAIRDKIVGFNTVDYGSSAYVWGDRTGTAIGVATGGAAIGKGLIKVATAVDDLGRCANPVAKFVMGGCFVAGTLITLSDMPRSQAADDDVWSMDDPVWHGTPYPDSAPNSATITLTQTATITSLLASPRRMLVPIEQVPLGARVPTKNPKPWEYDDSLPEPDQATWVKISLTVERTDGGMVDAELLRPRIWVESHGLETGKLLPLNIAELQVAGFAHVTAIGPCPTISTGEGSVITARFLTREVDVIVRAEILGPDGTIEVVKGTPIHPIWSLDRRDWVPLGELQQGESLQSQDGIATVVSIAILRMSEQVYNIEVHGEHVYNVGAISILAHNACEGIYEFAATSGQTYLGQSSNIAKRLAQHVSSGKLLPTTSVTVTPVSGGKLVREVVEQIRINQLGGIGNLANVVNPIGLARTPMVQRLFGLTVRQ